MPRGKRFSWYKEGLAAGGEPSEKILLLLGVDMMTDYVYDRALSLMRKTLKREVEKSNENQVAKRLKVPASTVHRWLDETRGTEMTLKKAIDISIILGVSVEDVLMDISPELGPALVLMVSREQKLFEDLLAIFEKGSTDDLDKLKSDITFLASKLPR